MERGKGAFYTGLQGRNRLDSRLTDWPITHQDFRGTMRITAQSASYRTMTKRIKGGICRPIRGEERERAAMLVLAMSLSATSFEKVEDGTNTDHTILIILSKFLFAFFEVMKV